MPCYYPIKAYRSNAGRNKATGKWPLVFDSIYRYTGPDPAGYEELTVACGQCIGCRLERARQWSIRCVHEASLHKQNCFLTLTYDDAHLPRAVDISTGEIGKGAPVLRKKDMVYFMKYLRKEYGPGIRFFQCGEYGGRTYRPHHHVLLFNFDFPDKKFFTTKNGFPLYTSESLRRLWSHGNHLIGSLTFESAGYTARYIVKKELGKYAKEYYEYYDIVPEYVTMSRRPGIAHDWIDKYMGDVFPSDEVIMRKKRMKPPRYYSNIFELQDPGEYVKVKLQRKAVAQQRSADNTYERLRVKERLQQIRMERLPRPLNELEVF